MRVTGIRRGTARRRTTALTTNPEIRQAVANRTATQEERVQGQGLWYPRVSVEGSAGVRSLRNPTRRSIGLADQTLYPIEGDLIVDPAAL